jgi:hypothetical protein
LEPHALNLTQPLLLFIRQNLQSIDQLETLLLLCKNRGRSWTPEEVKNELRTSIEGAKKSLGHLTRMGLIAPQPDETYSYLPRSPELDNTVTELSQAYNERRVSVINAIYATSDPIQALSDAFRLRQPKKDE